MSEESMLNVTAEKDADYVAFNIGNATPGRAMETFRSMLIGLGYSQKEINDWIIAEAQRLLGDEVENPDIETKSKEYLQWAENSKKKRSILNKFYNPE